MKTTLKNNSFKNIIEFGTDLKAKQYYKTQ